MSFYDVEGPVIRPAEQDMGFGNGYGYSGGGGGVGYGMPNQSTETMFPTPRPSGDPVASTGMRRDPTTASMYAHESRQQLQQQGPDYANFPVPSPVTVPVVGVAK